ncbi:hypothetical protein [Anaeromyxobacter sp. Fw109-5]|uniref:hypothetical protein n=1 Tax=Anaeromyxobacter sp. (strain Fw109-5) TaxID=404589 RepID=UPI00117F5190|nr:hypothetical protein [Anaeromyxobacter sp. Fw109-5]
MATQILFFLTRQDLLHVLKEFESRQRVHYVVAGSHKQPMIEDVHSLAEDPGAGVAVHGDAQRERAYLVAPAGTEIVVRAIPQYSGEVRYAVDQMANPGSILLRPGGIHSEGVMISGEASTISAEAQSVNLYRSLERAVRANCARVKSCFVGREAGGLLDRGWRLTRSVKAPAAYDLQRKGRGPDPE